jgi:hypothetical protein
MFCSRFRYPFPRVVSGFHQITRTAHYDRHHLPASCLAASYPPITNHFLRQITAHGDCLGPFIPIFGVLAFSGRGLALNAALRRCTIGGLSTVWFLQSQHSGLGLYAIMGLSSMLWFILSLEKVVLILASSVRDRLLNATRDTDGTI